MDENNLADFNDLNNLAREILSSVKNEIDTAQTELDKSQEAIRRLKSERDNLSGEVSKLTISNQTLTAELEKSQEAIRLLESERDYLRGEVSKLTTSNQTLTASLLKAQEESETLRSKIAQVQKLLAG